MCALIRTDLWHVLPEPKMNPERSENALLF